MISESDSLYVLIFNGDEEDMNDTCLFFDVPGEVSGPDNLEEKMTT